MDNDFIRNAGKVKGKAQTNSVGATPAFNPSQMINPSARGHFKDQIKSGQGSDNGITADEKLMIAKKDRAQDEAAKEIKAQGDALRKSQIEELKIGKERRNLAFEQAAKQSGRAFDKDEYGNLGYTESDEQFQDRRKGEIEKELEVKRGAVAKARTAGLTASKKKAEFERDDPTYKPLSAADVDKRKEQYLSDKRMLAAQLELDPNATEAEMDAHRDKAPERFEALDKQRSELSANQENQDRYDRFNSAARSAEARMLGLEPDDAPTPAQMEARSTAFQKGQDELVAGRMAIGAEYDAARQAYDDRLAQGAQESAEMRQRGASAAELSQHAHQTRIDRMDAESEYYTSIGDIGYRAQVFDEQAQTLQIEGEELDRLGKLSAGESGTPSDLERDNPDAAVPEDQQPHSTPVKVEGERVSTIADDAELGQSRDGAIVANSADSASKILSSDNKAPVYLADSPERVTDEEIDLFEKKVKGYQEDAQRRMQFAYDEAQRGVDSGKITVDQGKEAMIAAQNEIPNAQKDLGDAITDKMNEAMAQFGQGNMSAQQLNRMFAAAGEEKTGLETFQQMQSDHKKDEDAQIWATEQAGMEDFPQIPWEDEDGPMQFLRAVDQWKKDPSSAGSQAAMYEDYALKVEAHEERIINELKTRGIDGDRAAGIMRRAQIEAVTTRMKTAADVAGEFRTTDLLPFIGAAVKAEELWPIAKTALDLNDGKEVSPERIEEMEEYLVDIGREMTFGGTVTSILAELPAFMGEMAATWGIYSAGKAVTTKALVKGVELASGRKVKDILRRKAADGTAKRMMRWTGRNGIRAGASVAGATLQSPVAGLSRIPAGTVRKLATQGVESGRLQLGENDLGELEVIVNEDAPGMDIGKAFAYAVGDNWAEVVSEHSGRVFGTIAEPLKKPMLKLAFFRAMKKLNGKVTYGALGRAVKRSSWNGTLAEMGEERIGEGIRAGMHFISGGAVGDEYHVPTLKQIGAELVAFAVPGSAFGAMNEAARIKGEAPHKKKIKDADKRWASLKQLSQPTGAAEPSELTALVNKRISGEARQYTDQEVKSGLEMVGGDIEGFKAVQETDEVLAKAEAGLEQARQAGNVASIIGHQEWIATIKANKVDIAINSTVAAAQVGKELDSLGAQQPGMRDFASASIKLSAGLPVEQLTNAEKVAISQPMASGQLPVDLADSTQPIVTDEARQAILQYVPTAISFLGGSEAEARADAAKATKKEADSGGSAKGSKPERKGSEAPVSSGSVDEKAKGGEKSDSDAGAKGTITVRGTSKRGVSVATEVPAGTSRVKIERALAVELGKKSGDFNDILDPDTVEIEEVDTAGEAGAAEEGGSTGGAEADKQGRSSSKGEAEGESKPKAKTQSGDDAGGTAGGTKSGGSKDAGSGGQTTTGGKDSAGDNGSGKGRVVSDERGQRGEDGQSEKVGDSGAQDEAGVLHGKDKRNSGAKGKDGSGKPKADVRDAGRPSIAKTDKGISSADDVKAALEPIKAAVEAAGSAFRIGKIKGKHAALANQQGVQFDVDEIYKQASENGIDPAKTQEWLERLVSEELRHLALRRVLFDQWKSLSADSRGRAEDYIAYHFAELWKNDFVGTPMEAAVTQAYPLANTDAFKGEEGVRMVAQMMAEGKMTEEAQTWVAGASDKFKAIIKGAIKILRVMVANGNVGAGITESIDMMERELDAMFVKPTPKGEEGGVDRIMFASGLTTNPKRIRQATAEGKPVGIRLFEKPSKTVLKLVSDAANAGSPVFVDNGAFKTFTSGMESDWRGVVDKLNILIEMIDKDKRHLVYFVIPDVIGSINDTIHLQNELGSDGSGIIPEIKGTGATLIYPVQQGVYEGTGPSRTNQLYTNLQFMKNRYPEMVLDDSNAIIGIPFNKAAWSQDDVFETLKMLNRTTVEVNGKKEKRAYRIHLLGGGSSKVNPLLDRLEAAGISIDFISGDSRYGAISDDLHAAARARKDAAKAKKPAKDAPMGSGTVGKFVDLKISDGFVFQEEGEGPILVNDELGLKIPLDAQQAEYARGLGAEKKKAAAEKAKEQPKWPKNSKITIEQDDNGGTFEAEFLPTKGHVYTPNVLIKWRIRSEDEEDTEYRKGEGKKGDIEFKSAWGTPTSGSGGPWSKTNAETIEKKITAEAVWIYDNLSRYTMKNDSVASAKGERIAKLGAEFARYIAETYGEKGDFDKYVKIFVDHREAQSAKRDKAHKEREKARKEREKARKSDNPQVDEDALDSAAAAFAELAKVNFNDEVNKYTKTTLNRLRSIQAGIIKGEGAKFNIPNMSKMLLKLIKAYPTDRINLDAQNKLRKILKNTDALVDHEEVARQKRFAEDDAIKKAKAKVLADTLERLEVSETEMLADPDMKKLFELKTKQATQAKVVDEELNDEIDVLEAEIFGRTDFAKADEEAEDAFMKEQVKRMEEANAEKAAAQKAWIAEIFKTKAHAEWWTTEGRIRFFAAELYKALEADKDNTMGIGEAYHFKTRMETAFRMAKDYREQKKLDYLTDFFIEYTGIEDPRTKKKPEAEKSKEEGPYDPWDMLIQLKNKLNGQEIQDARLVSQIQNLENELEREAIASPEGGIYISEWMLYLSGGSEVPDITEGVNPYAMFALQREAKKRFDAAKKAPVTESVPETVTEPEAEKPKPAPKKKKAAPKLSPARQRLKDMLDKQEPDGAPAANLRPEDFIKPLNKEGRIEMLELGDELIADGINTPTGLAELLSDLGYTGFSQSVWGGFIMADPTVEANPDWVKVYDAINEAKIPKDGQSLATAIAEQLAAGEAIDKRALTKLAEKTGLKPKGVDEWAELGVVMAGRQIVADMEGQTPKAIFNRLVQLYEDQPRLSAKTSTSKIDQAYSTPIPMAYLASVMADAKNATKVGELSAGHGALLLDVEPENAVTNELNDGRRERLATLGFEPLGEDATKANVPEFKGLDAVVMNPPFGSIQTDDGGHKTWNVPWGTTTAIDHAIMINALENMTADGKAVFLIGGPNKMLLKGDVDKRADSYGGEGQRGKFFDHLYENYGVVDHFTVKGELYSKQGAGWPIDIIVIEGKKQSPIVLPHQTAPRIINSWEELAKETTRTNESRIESNQYDAVAVSAGIESSLGGALDAIEAGGTNGASGLQSGGFDGGRGKGQSVRGSKKRGSIDSSKKDSGDKGSGRKDGNGVVESSDDSEVSGNKFQAKYTPVTEGPSNGMLIPTNMRGPAEKALRDLAEKVGPLKEYVQKMLQYPEGVDIIDSHYYYAEQIDALALAIDNMEKQGGFILADQTGIGKGRVAAGMIRYAIKQGKVPVFFTEDHEKLYPAMMNDLIDTGSEDVIPAFTNNGVGFKDEKGRKYTQKGVDHVSALMEEVGKTGVLPGGANVLFTTYYQLQSDKPKGFKESKKESNSRKAQKMPPPDGAKMRALKKLAPNAIFILDESHNASGDSSRAWRLAPLLKVSAGAYYSSATFAKRPENTAIYFKTDLSIASKNMETLAETMLAGGVPLQQAVSMMLVEQGQMLRRERSFDGIDFDTYIGYDNEERDRGLADNYTEGLRAIIGVQNRMLEVRDRIQSAIRAGAKGQSSISKVKVDKLETQNFSSKAHSLVSQYLLAIKVESTVNRALKALKGENVNGTTGKKIGPERVVVVVENTMAAAMEAVRDLGVSKDFNGVLLAYLEKMKTIQIGTKEDGETFVLSETPDPMFAELENHQLIQRAAITTVDEDGTKRVTVDQAVVKELFRRVMMDEFLNVKGLIQGLDLAGMPISPIDEIRRRVEAEGYKTGEITGRKIALTEEGEFGTRPKDETSAGGGLRALDAYNNKDVSLLVVNRSGLTGISAHDSEKNKVSFPRRMLVAQPSLDINLFMQALGRIFRSGSLSLPSYEMIQTALPAEMRPAAILATKLAMLSANTTSNADSDVSEGSKKGQTSDIFNEYGDQMVLEYLRKNPEFARAVQQSWGKAQFFAEANGTIKTWAEVRGSEKWDKGRLAAGVSGHVALFYAHQQDSFWLDVNDEYDAFIAYLDEIGKNDLKAEPMDIKAKTINKEIWTGGANADSVFAGPSFLETVDAELGKKPASADEVWAERAEVLKSVDGIVSEYETAAQDYITDEVDRMVRSSKDTEAKTKERADESRLKKRGIQRTITDMLRKVGSVGTYQREGAGEGVAVVVGVKVNLDKPMAASAQKFELRVNGSEHTVKVPGSQLKDYFNPAYVSGEAPFAERWNESIDFGHQRNIITGNLLSAREKSKEGRFITYTDDAEGVHMGILLPASVTEGIKKAAERRQMVNDATGALKGLFQGASVTNENKSVELRAVGNVKQGERHEQVKLGVPGSKSLGGKFWRDKALNALMNGGEFAEKSGQMVATFAQNKLDHVIDRLGELGSGNLFYDTPDADGAPAGPLNPESSRQDFKTSLHYGQYESQPTRKSQENGSASFGELGKAAVLVQKRVYRAMRAKRSAPPSSQKEQDKLNQQTVLAELNALREFFAENDAIFDSQEFTSDWKDQGQIGGLEHYVVFREGEAVKANNRASHDTWGQYFDRLMLHNEILPHLAYDIKGMLNNVGSDGYPAIVVSQKVIKGESGEAKAQRIAMEETGTDEFDWHNSAQYAVYDRELKKFQKLIEAYMAKEFDATQDLYDHEKYHLDGGVTMEDVRPENVIENPEGELMLFDTILRQKTREEEERFRRNTEGPLGIPAAALNPPEPKSLAGSLSSLMVDSGADDLGFTSGMEKLIAAKMQKGAKPAQVMQLLNPTKHPVKQAEIDYTGIKEWLEGKDKVTKAEVLEFIRSKRIKFREQRKGQLPSEEELEARTEELHDERVNEEIERLVDQHHMDEDEIDRTDISNNISWWESEEKAADELTESPRFRDYSFHGPSDYREVIIQLPNPELTEEEARKQPILHGRKAEPPLTEKEMAMARRESKPEFYHQGHWPGMANPAVHLRVGDMLDADTGKRILFIHEVQSDWATAINKREKALKENVEVDAEAMFAKMRELEAEKRAIQAKITKYTPEELDELHKLIYRADNFGVENGTKAMDVISNYAEEHLPEWLGEPEKFTPRFLELAAKRRKYIQTQDKHFPDVLKVNERIMDLQQKLDELELEDVPPMPFAKTYHELGLKRALQIAVEEGYSGVSWATGEQQIDLYTEPMRQNVDKIVWDKRPGPVDMPEHEGFINIEAFKEGEDSFRQNFPVNGDKVNFGTAKGETLTSTIGANMANQILSSEEDSGEITGEGLSIGGHFHKSLYDVMVPSFLKKFGKKYGGKVAPIRIELVDSSDDYEPHPMHSTPTSWERGFDEAGDGSTIQPGFLIPDAMKKELEENGTPAFAARLGETGPVTVPDDASMKAALPSNKKDKVGAARDLPEGTTVSVRLDLPSANKGVATQTIHKGTIGTVLGYDGAVRLDNPVMVVREKAAINIHEGGNKSPMAAVKGGFVQSREIPSDLAEWTPLRFNPKVHAYFFPSEQGDKPVISADEAYMVGFRAFVKGHVKFGDQNDYAYAQDIDAPEGTNEDDLQSIIAALEELAGEAPNNERVDKIRQVAAHEPEGQQTIGNPDIANPADDPTGRKDFNAVRMAYEGQLESDAETQEQWSEEAARRIKEDKAGVIEELVAAAQAVGTFGKWQVKAAQMLINQLRAEAYALNSKKLHRTANLISYAYMRAGTEQARAFAARRDVHRTPAERHLEFISNVIAYLPKEEEALIKKRWLPEVKARKIKEIEKKIVVAQENIDPVMEKQLMAELAKVRANFDQSQAREKMLSARLKKIEKILTEGYGVSMQEIFNGEAVVRLRGSKIVDKVLQKNFTAKGRQALRMWIDGYKERAISGATGLHRTKEIPELQKRFQRLMKRRFRELYRQGITLNDFLTEEDKFFGTPTKDESGAPAGDLGDKEEEDAAVDAMMAAMFAGTMSANAKKIDSKGDGRRKHKGKKLEKKRFDPNDRIQAIEMVRALQSEIDGNGYDTLYEWWIMNILSGPQTQFVNVTGNTANVAFEYTFQRMFEAGWNTILKNKSSASFGEFGQMIKAFKKPFSGIFADALEQAQLAWNTEISFFEADNLNDYSDFDKSRGKMEMRKPKIKDKVLGIGSRGGATLPGAMLDAVMGKGFKGASFGKTVRMPGKALLFMDTFFKSVVGKIEVLGQAYRIGKANGLEGEKLKDFISAEVRTPGSASWHGAVKKAQELTFTNPLRTHKDGGGALEGLAKSVMELRASDRTLGPFGAFVLAFFVPFVQTPFRIFQAGLRRTPLGLLGILKFYSSGIAGLKNGDVTMKDEMQDRMARDLADQTTSMLLTWFLISFAEGDDDDDEKPLLITGSHPYGVEGSGERDASVRRDGGPFMIRIGNRENGFWLDYGRFEPVAVALGSVTDSVRSSKRIKKGAPLDEEAAKIVHYIAAQGTEKTFLKGLASVWEFVQSPERKTKAIPKFLASAIVPNLIRQPIRNLDNYQRDYYTAPWYYHALPLAGFANKKIDLYGNPVKKGETPLSGGESNPWARLLWDVGYAADEKVHPIDQALYQWAVDHPNAGESYYPTRNRKNTFVNAEGENEEMTPDELELFNRIAGKDFAAQGQGAITPFDAENPTEQTVSDIRSMRSKPWTKARKDLFKDGSRPYIPKKPRRAADFLFGKKEKK